MDENPYRAPEYVSDAGAQAKDEWPGWVRMALGKKNTLRSRVWLLVGCPVVWVSLFCSWLWTAPEHGLLLSAFQLVVLCFYTAIAIHGLFAFVWVWWHDAWRKNAGDGGRTTANEKRGNDSRA
jgi:hypothetical protein